ncbi:hypothetical protein HPB47_010840 [Ixodes persulcatus]|uniref:Uncharacterized protein n=1 Tax=Ixodes persulcatus TaxID=34615 RepID=A0AC60NY72_IXOPE|nr:hypothetical protein HPB47_010840 [Ixodes persulcatus]
MNVNHGERSAAERGHIYHRSYNTVKIVAGDRLLWPHRATFEDAGEGQGDRYYFRLFQIFYFHRHTLQHLFFGCHYRHNPGSSLVFAGVRVDYVLLVPQLSA